MTLKDYLESYLKYQTGYNIIKITHISKTTTDIIRVHYETDDPTGNRYDMINGLRGTSASISYSAFKSVLMRKHGLRGVDLNALWLENWSEAQKTAVLKALANL